MRQVIISLLILLLSVSPAAATIVMDASTGEPLPMATVFNSKGNIVGICLQNGEIPYVSDSDYPLSVSYLGYKTGFVENKGVEVVNLIPIPYDLPDVIIDSKRQQVLHLKGFVREYSSMIKDGDSVFLFREKNIDFMLPLKTAKNYKGWNLPRLLSSKSYYHFTDRNGLDSVSDQYSGHFSWTDWMGIVRNPVMPAPIRLNQQSRDTITGQFGTRSQLWKRNGENISLDIDVLASEENKKWIPGISHFLDGDVDFTRFNVRYDFSDVLGGDLFADNIYRVSFNIEANGNGRNFSRLGNPKSAVYMDTYAELYITDREYLSVSEAKKIEKNIKGDSEVEIPRNVPALLTSIENLKQMVGEIDHDLVRQNREADKRLAGRDLKGDKYGYGLFPSLKRVIKKLGFQF